MSNEPTIEQKNQVIAVFMGWKFIKGDPNHKCNFCFAGDEPCTPALDRFVKDKDMRVYYEFKYHSSWDWLMPVVKKIKSMHFDLRNQAPIFAYMEAAAPMNSALIQIDLQKLHEGVYIFLTWFNKQQSNEQRQLK
jgi:hypothetical protein